MLLDTVYRLSPIPIQNLFCSIYGWKENKVRFNGEFREIFSYIVGNEYLPKELIDSIQREKLTAVLLAGKSSRLYEKLMAVEKEQIIESPIEVLESLPIINKEIIRGWHERLELTDSLIRASTSGTTGRALQLYKSKYSVAFQWAVWFRHRKRFGVNWGDTSVNFTGKPVVPKGQKKPPYWRVNRAQNQYLISMQYINNSTIHSIVEFLTQISPIFYSGYPSIIAELSRVALEHNLFLPEEAKPKVIFLGAEKLLNYQVESIEKWLGSETIVTDQYGLTEGNCNYSKCEYGEYHEDFEFTYSEVVRTNLTGVNQNTGRLVGTGLLNLEFPLIRYDTGDLATIYETSKLCKCGRHSKLLKNIDGRIDDYIILPDQTRLMRVDYIFKNTFEVLEAQVIQKQLNQVIILSVIKNCDDKTVFEQKVRENFIKYIHPNMPILFEYTDKIERSNTGKFKAIINKL